MRLFALLGMLAAAAVVLSSCGGSGPPQIKACAEGRSTPHASASPAPPKAFVGVLRAAADSSAALARLEPLSLRPVSRQVEVGEYHDAWSLSPDRAWLALGVSSGENVLSPSQRLRARIGIYIVDLKAMKLVREVQTGVAAEALAWLGRRRLVAALQRGGTVLVDPFTGRIMRRRPGFSFADASTPTPQGLVMLLPQLRNSAANMPLTRVSGAARLAVVDARGRLRSVTLTRIQLGVHTSNGFSNEDRAGLAVDSARARAYVVAANAPVAEVDLRTMHVTYRRVLAGTTVERNDARPALQRQALWLGGGQVAVFGRDLIATDGGKLTAIPAGVTLINTHDWGACRLDERASRAALASGRLLTYGPGTPVSRHEPDTGLRAYVVGRGETFHLFDREQVWDVKVVADDAYVRTATAVHIVDAKSGKVMATIARPLELADVISGTS
jgi:hypothetical protein